MSELDERIAFGRDELQHHPQGHTDRATVLYDLAFLLYDRFREEGEISDLNEALALNQESLSLRTKSEDDDRVRSLLEVASCLHARYKQLGTPSDLEDAIALQRNALELCPQEHPDRAISLVNMAEKLHTRFTEFGALSDLDEALALQRNALELVEKDDPDRAFSLGNLPWYHYARFSRLGTPPDLDEALALERQTLELRPPGNPYRIVSLGNMALYLRACFLKAHGTISALNEAITLHRNALELCPQGHPERATFLSNTAESLLTRFHHLGIMSDLDEGLVLHRSALELRPLGHPRRASSLGDVASCLNVRFTQLGMLSDLDEAIALHRNSLELIPQTHPERPALLSNTANCLLCRFHQLRTISDLDDALALERSALKLRPDGHPGLPLTMGSIARCLHARFIELGVLSDIDEAIALERKALELIPLEYTHRAASLGNIASHLYARFDRLKNMSDLDEAITLAYEVLEHRPHSHLLRAASQANIACYSYARFIQLGTQSDLDDAIAHERSALELRPKGHPDRPISIRNLAFYLHARFKFSSMDDTSDLQETFSLYSQLAHIPHTASFDFLSCVKQWIQTCEEHRHDSTLLAYKTFLRLSVHYFTVLPSLRQHLALFKQLLASLPVDAFSACVRHGNLADAVELLEQGRGVFWSQLLRLRSPLDDVIASGSKGRELADKFAHLSSLLHSVLNGPSTDAQSQHEQACHLQIQLQDIVDDIRKLPGLSRFLQPPLFPDLQIAASAGPVIIVNASQYGCDALIVLAAQDPIHVFLPITKAEVCGLSSDLRKLLLRAKREDVLRDLLVFLRELWDQVVFPIVAVLREHCPRRSRIWWCPTAEFSFLPLHAAGTYRKGQPNLSSLYISSYTPTLTALICARSKPLQNTSAEPSRFLIVGQAHALGYGDLASVNDELSKISQRIGPVARLTRIQDQDANIANVSRALASNDLVHLSCHGIPDRAHPFASGFALGDGLLDMEHILRHHLQHAQFAYLSACHTTAGDDTSPDEVLHLAAAMQFAGFRSVIGTMWAVEDAHTCEMSARFYECMLDGRARLEYDRAAWALHRTARTVSEAIPFDQRILYVHIGA